MRFLIPVKAKDSGKRYKSLIPTFGLLSGHYYHTFAESKD